MSPIALGDIPLKATLSVPARTERCTSIDGITRRIPATPRYVGDGSLGSRELVKNPAVLRNNRDLGLPRHHRGSNPSAAHLARSCAAMAPASSAARHDSIVAGCTPGHHAGTARRDLMRCPVRGLTPSRRPSSAPLIESSSASTASADASSSVTPTDSTSARATGCMTARRADRIMPSNSSAARMNASAGQADTAAPTGPNRQP